MTRPRILIIENSTAVTGALKSIIRSSQGLEVKYDFIFLLPKNGAATKYVQDQGFRVYELPMKEIRKNIPSLLSYLPTLFYNTKLLSQLIKELQIDLINVNDFYNLLPASYKFWGGRKRYIVYVRFLPSKFPDLLVNFWCTLHKRYADVMIAVSQAVKNELPYKDKVITIGNELPADKISFSIPASKIILYPANYIDGKGHQCALQSFALIINKHPQWKLKFVGGDMGLQKNRDFKNSLIELARTLDITEQVEWHDFANNISAEYIQACFVLNFSESESFSMTCLEAMFYGRPVIATRSGGPSEIIDHDISGILVDVKDINSMANAMDYLISHPDKREAMAKRAYESVRQKFSFANTIEKLGYVYSDAIKKGPR